MVVKSENVVLWVDYFCVVGFEQSFVHEHLLVAQEPVAEGKHWHRGELQGSQGGDA